MVGKYDLSAESELRIEIINGNTAGIKLIRGTAEIFGTEIVQGKTYTFQNICSLAVFTWDEKGCSIEVDGNPESVYVSVETPMVTYINTHAGLEQLRDVATATDKPGPRVMITGPADVGKSTVARLLMNYAARAGRRPLMVDLDMGQGTVGIPGTLSMLSIDHPVDVVEGFSSTTPVCYHFGCRHASDNPRLFQMLIERMAKTADQRCQEDAKIKASGFIIDTCGLNKDALLSVQKAFCVDVILVIDHERLFNELTIAIPEGTQIVKLFKSGGVIARDESMRTLMRTQRVKKYFYGAPGEDLNPYSFDVRLHEVKMFKIGAPPVPTHCLPIGAEITDNETQLVAMNLEMELLHSCFAVSGSAPDWQTKNINIVDQEVIGFVSIQNVDLEARTITMLSPAPHPLPTAPCTLLFSQSQRFSDAAS